MSAVLASELLKLRTTRTTAALAGSALGLVALIVGVAAATGDWAASDGAAPPGEDLLGIAGLAQLFALVLGILAVTTELRHGTITPSLLVVPDRVRLVGGKLAVHVLAGLALGVAAVALALLLSEGVFALRGVDSGLTGTAVVELGGGTALSIALYAALGVGVGAIVRNQVGAIVGALAYLFVVEGLLTIIPGVGDAVETYGVGGVTAGLAPSEMGPGDVLGQVPAGLLLAAYAAALVLAGMALMRRRDIGG